MNSTDFLQRFHPGGPWVLTAIQPDRKGIETKTFTELGPAKTWVDKYNGKRNLYFSVNLPMHALSKKANREDIDAVSWLHVDVDSRAGEPLEEELPRIKGLLTEHCPIHAPTVVIFSGGGYQAFWKLDEPIPIKGDIKAAEEAALYNKQLEIVFEGDNCHDVSRIMRLPGTTNLPNARKVEKGRTPTQAELLFFEDDRVYNVSHFTPAPAIQVPGLEPDIVAIQVGNIARLDSVDVLDEWKVPDRVKVIIVQGYHPDEVKDGDSSRSAWLFDAVCQMVRAGVPDETIFNVVTDPDFGISASVLDKKPKEVEYASHQIKRAKEEVEEPWLRILNERFMVIGNLGGRCRVCEELYDGALRRVQLTKQSFTDFRNRFSAQYIQVSPKKKVTVGNYWLGHPQRRQYDYLVFSPGQAVKGAYNLWQGFACHSLPGDGHEPFMKHVLDNVCSGNEDHYHYVVGWMARAIQYPDSTGETAIVMRGKSGTGKSFFAKGFGSVLGRHFLQVSNPNHLVGEFNTHLRDCVVLFGDEAFYAGDKKHESVLKTLITEERVMITAKGVDSEVSPNFIHLILASNSDWVVPTGATERRFCVLDVGDNHQQDNPYFKAIQDALDNGGRENLLHHLLTYGLADFNVRKVPLTKALAEQKIHSMDSIHDWWYERLMEGTLISSRMQWESEVFCEELVDSYIAACVRYNIQRRASSIKLGLFLTNMCPGRYPLKGRESIDSRRYFYRFPDLQVLRDKWDDLFGSETDWPKVVEERVSEPF